MLDWLGVTFFSKAASECDRIVIIIIIIKEIPMRTIYKMYADYKILLTLHAVLNPAPRIVHTPYLCFTPLDKVRKPFRIYTDTVSA